jgi:hypothetical protein
MDAGIPKTIQSTLMNTNELVEWQIYAPNGLVYPWWTHPFLEVLEKWDLKETTWLEFGGGRSTAYLRSRCKWVDTIEANSEWASQAHKDCAGANLSNGVIYSSDIPDGIQGMQEKYFGMIPDTVYDIISIDGIFRTEAIQWAINHFKGRDGVLVLDNLDQDFVWISPKAMELLEPYKGEIFIQPNHTNHEGKPWNTRYYKIPA